MALGETAKAVRIAADAIDFRVVADAMPQLVWVASADGTIEYFNERWTQYTGVSLADFNAGHKGIVHPEEVDETIERWQRCVQTGEPYEMEYRLRRACDRSYRWFVARALPVRDADGRLAHWIGSATDIDEQRRASDNLKFISDATSGFSGLRDVDEICRRLADYAIRRVADWGFVIMTDGAFNHRIAAIAHRDPQLVRYVEEFRDRYPILEGSPTDLAIRKNFSMLRANITQADIEAAAQDEEHLKILNRLHMRSAITIPLTGDSGRAHGALVLVSAESARIFTDDDLQVAERVGRRAGAAIETALEIQEERTRAARLRFIARATEVMFETLDLQTGFDRVCELIVNEMADLAFVLRCEEGGVLRTVASAHRNPEMRAVAARLRGQRTLKPASEDAAMRMLSQHRTVVHAGVEESHILPHMWEYLASEVRALGVRSAITVPLFARGETYGGLIAYWCETPRSYGEGDVPIFEDLGRRISVAIEHASAFERERRISVSLQQALLPTDAAIPQREDLDFATEYRPSSTEAEVGGDWFDAFTRADGSIVVCVGDVTGRGLDAAGLMGKLRQSIGIAAMYESDPTRILNAVDQHLRSRRAQAIATAFLGIIDRDHATITFANAGHPPPLLRCGDRVVELRAEGLPLGLRDLGGGSSRSMPLEDAQLLVLYTDGLLEGTRDYLFGERRLRGVVESEAILCVRNPAHLLCDACLPRDAQDDTAVLTVRFGRRKEWQFDAENAQAANDARKEFVDFVRSIGTSSTGLHSAELIFGELVSNVVRHAPGPIDVQLDTSGNDPVLHVIDRGTGFIRDPALPSDPLSESGRGLYIISRLAKSLAVERIPGYGNHVAATLKL